MFAMNIYEYLDYRQFIKDFCEERMRDNPHFSYRYISSKAGIKSSGYLSMIISGERNLTDLLAKKIAAVFKLNKKECVYFIALVHFNQARSVEDRAGYYKEILSCQSNPVKTLFQDSFELYDRWYYSAIRELVEIFPINNNYIEVSKLLNPQVKPSEVEKALEVLTRLQLIYMGSNGFYRRTDEVITSSRQPHSYILQQFQMQFLDIAKGAYDRYEKEEREVSTLTLSIDHPTYLLMKERLARCRMELLELARNVKNPTCVYQLNMQIHPLSVTKEECRNV